MAVGLLISGNVWAGNVAKIVETDTEYATFAKAVSAVKANQTIQLLDDASYTPSAGYNFWGITYNLTILVGTHTLTLTVGSDQSYGVFIYNNANVTIEGELDANTNKYGTIEFTQNTHVAAFLLEDISLLTLKNVHIKTNHTWVVNVSNYKGNCSSLFLGENVTFEGTSPYDVLLNNYSQSSNITIEGIHDGLKFDIASQTNGANIINNGTLTNLILHDNAGSVPTYSGTGTYELAKGSRVHKNTMSQIESKTTIATGCLSVLKGDYYEVVEPSFSVNGVGYADLNAAMAQSTEANPVLLLEDVEYGPYLVDHGGWLDLNGHTIFVTGENGLQLIGNQNYVFMDNSSAHTGKIENYYYSYALYLNPGINLKLLGGTYQNSNEDDDAEAVIYYNIAEGYDPINVTIDGANTHIIADYCTGIAMPCEVAGNVITVRNGATITAQDFCIANLGTYTDMNTTMNIESGAQLTSTTAAAIYHPGGGYLNISGDNTLIQGVETGVEIRAGELNMTGGKVTCTGSTISCNPNGNGTTTSGAGISVAQHTTTQPIIVNISGGVVSGPFALVQLNPQSNAEENYLKMKVNVTGGKFITTKSEGGSLLNGDGKFGTVTYDANAMLLSQNRRILVSGGYYKDYDPAPFVMPGYVSVLLSSITNLTPEDEQAIKDGYKYKVTKITESGSEDNSKDSGDWHENAGTIWNSGEEPDKLTQVTISGQKIVVSTPATAYGIKISGTEEGNTKLTITETGRLMVDLGGINGTTPITFDIENGGQMAIAPAAAQETESQPEATVTLVADWAHRKADADSKADNELLATDLYWQHIATPLSDGQQPTPSQKGVSYVNTWNLVNGWTSATWANVVTPFVGYQVSSINKSTDDKIYYTFKGQLVGNHVDPMKFSRIGFSFFGNSYLAPIDIRELLTCLETRDVVDPTILLYNSKDGIYAPINRASFYIPGTIAEIKPMQGFFVFAESAANVDFDYTKAVWNSFCAKAQSGVVVPTAPKMEENPFSAIACIDIKAENGAADRVMLFEGDELSAAEDKGYDAHKMMTSGMNIYAKGSYADLAILATDNLLGSELILKTDANTNYTMSFANIKGEYALYDALTGSTINMTEGATYEFQAQAEATITDRFFVVEAAKAPTKMANIGAQAGSCKFMKQGIMFIERNNKVYNAQGQIVK